jgi:3-hydroxyisobutyrate dehydrogenase
MATDDQRQPTVALLGAGIMGAGMGRNLAGAGLPLRVWNRTQAKAEALEGNGATAAGSPAEAVRDADVIVTMLADGQAVRESMEAAAPGLHAGQVWAQTSTVGLLALRELTALAAEHDLVFVDSPVLGTRQPAEEGALIVFASGPAQAREPLGPVLDAIGKKTVWLGEEPGAASRLKLVANNWVLSVTGATAETLALARGLGADPEAFLEAISGGPLDCAYLRTKAQAIMKEDFTPSFTVALAGKDAELVVVASQSNGVRMDMTDALAHKFARAADLGHADEDMSAVYFACFDENLDG